jgi:hypothetical protein
LFLHQKKQVARSGINHSAARKLPTNCGNIVHTQEKNFACAGPALQQLWKNRALNGLLGHYWLCCAEVCRQTKPKLRALSNYTIHTDCSVVLIDYTSAYRETQPGAAEYWSAPDRAYE